jgi:hypothetical protein
MSSATSIERSAPRTDASFKPWHFFLLASLIAATVAVLMSGPSSPEHLILISLTIAAAGVAAAGFYRMLAPLASTDMPSTADVLSERARAALEREKALTLRSIKELEFDSAMGKISQRDFDEMAGRLRARAVSLMKQLDVGDAGYRTAIERELDARLARRGAATPRQLAQPRACADCGTRNDADAAFCKRCGSKLAQAGGNNVQ